MISFENTDQILQLAWDGLSDVENIQNERDGNAKEPSGGRESPPSSFTVASGFGGFKAAQVFFFFSLWAVFLPLISIICLFFVTEVGLTGEISGGWRRSPRFTASLWTVDGESRRSKTSGLPDFGKNDWAPDGQFVKLESGKCFLSCIFECVLLWLHKKRSSSGSCGQIIVLCHHKRTTTVQHLGK